ncbi:MAG: efflux RND transporter permease subunit [Bacillota bacterium]
MEALSNLIVKKRKLIIVLFVLMGIISAILSQQVNTNYYLSKYLPEGMTAKAGIEKNRLEFGAPGMARLMSKDVTIPEALEIKKQISKIDGVDIVLWLDDEVSIYQPIEFIAEDLLKTYYRDGNALFQIVFAEEDDSPRTSRAIDKIYSILGENSYIAGTAVNSKAMRETTESQVGKITMGVIPIVLIILLLSTSSWFEPVLFMIVIGFSILLNKGSNILLGEVSFMTQSMTTALTLAISMDYSIYLLHSFAYEKEAGLSIESSMINAIKKSFVPILSSAATTIAGFLALTLMKFKIGTDMGLVFAKGIVFSLVCVLFLLPALTLVFEKLIEKTHHRMLIPSFKGLGKVLVKLRIPIIILVLLLLIPSYLGQNSNEYIYGDSAITASEGTRSYDDQQEINSIFGKENIIIMLVPRGDTAGEAMMAEELSELDAVKKVQTLITYAGAEIPESILPDSLTENFRSDDYTRLVIAVNTAIESELAFKTVSEIKKIAAEYYGDKYYMTGSSVVADDIREITTEDYSIVSLISILAVGIIVMLAFRSVSIPAILVFAIEAAIFINMSIPYFTGKSISYIGFLIVSSIQLGATIDYAIMLTSQYVENRKQLGKKESIINAIGEAGSSISTSALIMCVSGFMIGRISTVATISEMGTLIGRGALLSGVMVIAFLPQLLLSFDGIIRKTTRTTGFMKVEG